MARLRIWLLVLVVLTGPAMAETLKAGDPAGLQAALAQAAPGDVIELAAGDYGQVTITARFGDWVTIRAAAPLGAGFERLNLVGASHLLLEGLRIGPDAGGGGGEALLAIENSDHIEVRGAEVSGPATGTQVITGYFGIRTRASSAITVSGAFVHDVLNGMAFFSSRDLTISGNRTDRIGADAFKLGNVDGALFENNTGPSLLFPEEDTHSDFLQVQGSPSRNLTIRGNVFLPQNRFDTQGIFVAGDGGHQNVLIEDNIIHTKMANGIYVADSSTGVVVEDNTLLAADGEVTRISAPEGARVTGNVQTLRKGRLDANLALQGGDPEGEYYLGTLFPGFRRLQGLSLDDLVPAPGSPAATMGASRRLAELLGQ